MKETADVVIIGGGVHGTSIAYHLAHMGCPKVILLEKSTIASGPTGKTFGLIRQHYSHDFMIQIVKESVSMFKNFEQLVGSQSDFVENGFILMGTEDEREAMTSIVQMQKRLGVPAELLDSAQVSDLIPGINMEGVTVACYEQNSGFADGYAVSMGFANKARQLGVKIYEERPALGMQVVGGKIAGVQTKRGDIETRAVVNAAGPWARDVARWVGVDLPIELDILQEALVQPKVTKDSWVRSGVSQDKRNASQVTDRRGLSERAMPTLIDLTTLIYFRPETGDKLIVGGGEHAGQKPTSPEIYPSKPTAEFVEQIAARLQRRMPKFANAEYIRGWTGLIDVTPDYHPIVGRIEPVDGFLLSCGYSGHGFKEAPMMGKLVAEEILQRKTSIDISALKLSRFQTGTLLRGRYTNFPILA